MQELLLLFFELFPLELCQSQICVSIMSASYLENAIFTKLQSTLDNVQTCYCINIQRIYASIASCYWTLLGELGEA